MPTVCFTGRPVRSDASAVAIVMPALGPSFGIAPAGTWTWNVASSKADSSMPSSCACARDVREGDAGRLLHHVAELARQDELAVRPLHRRSPRRRARRRRCRSRPGRSRRPASPSARPPPGRTSAGRARRGRASRSTATGASAVPDAIFVAVLRRTLPSSRSSWRTPASRVYSATTVSDQRRRRSRPRPRAGRCARAAAARGSRARSRPSRRPCSRRSG